MIDFDSFFNKKKDPVEIARTYKIRNRQIKEQKLLSQGAFGYIWKAIDINTKQIFALKRVICCNQQRLNSAKAEMEAMGKLKQSPNVVKFYGGCIDKDNGNPVVITLMELCPNGNLFDLMATRQDKGFTEKQLLKIIEQVAIGIKSINQSGFAHRDIKIENVLLGTDKSYKLCDFGSCTDKEVDFSRIPKTNYSDYEQEFQTNTTPMYRPPEIVDPFKKFKVSKQVDVWMLGCVLYTLAYFVHPFIDASKAGISDAAFRINKQKCSDKINDFIRNMLTPNPEHRITIDQVIAIIKKWDTFSQIPLNKQAKRMKDQFEKKQRELSVYDKKTVGYDDDIPIQVLMKLQNELKQKGQKPLTTFKTQQQPKLVQKISQPVPLAKSNSNKVETTNNNNFFTGFEFNNIPKPSADSWQKGDDFFSQPVKKAHSLQFNFFDDKNPGNQNTSLQSNNSKPNQEKNLTTQSEFYQFFSFDSGIKKEASQPSPVVQTTQFDFL